MLAVGTSSERRTSCKLHRGGAVPRPMMCSLQGARLFSPPLVKNEDRAVASRACCRQGCAALALITELIGMVGKPKWVKDCFQCLFGLRTRSS